MARRRTTTHKQQLEIWPGDTLAAPSLETVCLLGRTVHLIGVGGIGMSAIARLLAERGCIVSGCDVNASDITAALAEAQIPVSIGHSPDHLTSSVDLVIISAAVRDTNPELRAAQRRGIEVLKYAHTLACLMSGREGVAVAGSHGKTTTSSMIAYAMSAAGKDPGMVIGGLVPQLGGNVRSGGEGPFVVEACEYDRSFLSLRPKVAVITNIDRDHMDYYRDLAELVDAFSGFAQRTSADGLVVVNGDDPNALQAASRARTQVVTFGESRGCTWRIGEWERNNGRTRFQLYCRGRVAGSYELLVPGLYNIRNAVACLAACDFFGLDRSDARQALAAFRGVRRRFDQVGEVGGVMVFDDYGHHPTEVKVTLDAVRKEFPKRTLWCVFQPHQCSRTRIFLEDFAKSLSSADKVIIPDIYSVRDTPADRRSIHARDLVAQLKQHGVEATYKASFDNVITHLRQEVSDGDVVITMGAGPVDHVGRRLLDELRQREQPKKELHELALRP